MMHIGWDRPRFLLVLGTLAASVCAAPIAIAADRITDSLGTWTNPQRSVQVRPQRCGKAICATVVWANEKAQADARRGGTEKLVGAQLFTGFVRESETMWRGKVFVPDMRKTFSGTVTFLNPKTIEAKGCLLGRVGCKSQTWTRISD